MFDPGRYWFCCVRSVVAGPGPLSHDVYHCVSWHDALRCCVVLVVLGVFVRRFRCDL